MEFTSNYGHKRQNGVCLCWSWIYTVMSPQLTNISKVKEAKRNIWGFVIALIKWLQTFKSKKDEKEEEGVDKSLPIESRDIENFSVKLMNLLQFTLPLHRAETLFSENGKDWYYIFFNSFYRFY
jgi:hypothetical protein